MALAAGSAAVRALLTGPRQVAEVVEAVGAAVYLALPAGDLVAVVCRDAVRVPVAVVVPLASSDLPFAGIAAGEAGWVGDGAVGLPDGRSWRVARWWDPSVPRVVVGLDGLPGGFRPGAPEVRPEDPYEAELYRALAGGDDDDLGRLDAAVAGLVGRGPGLTPEGDDVLAGALVALAALDSRLRAPLAAAVEAVLATSPTRTTTVSAALLRSAVRGRTIPELSRFLRTGERAPLLAVGHTSGAALARGAGLAMLAHAGTRAREAA